MIYNPNDPIQVASMYGRTQFHDHLKLSLELYARASEAMDEFENSGEVLTLAQYLYKYWVDDYPIVYNLVPYFQRMMTVPKLNINRFAHQMTLIARKERKSSKKRK